MATREDMTNALGEVTSMFTEMADDVRRIASELDELRAELAAAQEANDRSAELELVEALKSKIQELDSTVGEPPVEEPPAEEPPVEEPPVEEPPAEEPAPVEGEVLPFEEQ